MSVASPVCPRSLPNGIARNPAYRGHSEVGGHISERLRRCCILSAHDDQRPPGARRPRCTAELAELKIIGHQFVKGFASALVNLRRGRVDQVAVAIERAEKALFIKSNTWLNPLQRIPIDEK